MFAEAGITQSFAMLLFHRWMNWFGVYVSPFSLALVLLTLKVQIKTAADDIHKYFFHWSSEKIRLDVSSES